MKFALVQLTPKDMRNQNSINLGLEIIADIIVSKGWELDLYKYGDIISDVDSYDIIGFSIFYYTQMLNLIPFLKQNNIEPLSHKRKSPILIAGGQGIQNPMPIADFINIVSMGNGEGVIEYILDNYNDIEVLKNNPYLYLPNIKDHWEFNNIDVIDSKPQVFNKFGMIELTRGCKYRCKFCQYAWTNGKYREKDISLVKKQIDTLLDKGIRNINLLSCNLGGYTKILEVLDYCIERNVRLMNSDMRINEYSDDIAARLDKLKVRTLKVGIESFSEDTRRLIGKPITKQELDIFINKALANNISNIHFYLIYGLPEDNYSSWFEYMKYISDIRKTIDRNVRIEFSITNFEPSIYTPYENADYVDFNAKHEFLRKFLITQEDLGYIKQDAKTKDYKNTHGRLGRKQRSYNIGMWLLHGDKSISKVLLELDKGISRSIDSKMYDKIKNLCKEYPEVYQIMDINTENIWE